jgi:hypothetical protein
MSAIVPYGSSRSLAKATNQQLAVAEARAFVYATEIRAIEFVARVGLQSVADLSDMEGRLIAQVPLAEARLKAIADSAAGAIAAEVIRMAT